MRFLIGDPPIQTAARWLLVSASPVPAKVGDGLAAVTHDFCVMQAKEILRNDGHEAEARQLAYHLAQLNEGVAFVDQSWRNVAHYYNPVTRRGLFGGPSAVTEIEHYFRRAVRLYREKKTTRAMFFLGAACHFVQDLCVPHHAMNAIFSGHREFETFAEENRYNYAVTFDGAYHCLKKPVDWVDENARVAYDFFTAVSERNTVSFDRALTVLLPLAQRTTAGFVKYFFDTVSVGD
ncbi:phospholipase [Heliobacterium gestii]|uniref:Phospholipase C n=1 Tax=Heliomicrobium gestii TaxID=2699 RepID=A0A845LJT7_HELGE|nr:zinc dependent phospholipase C family protein [Heliomicrobium gestii]MBM7868500.1 phospholipase C [Heliomicrobium gestii]MZP44655.1 phospholipase [Heliomicrobium gestii]